MVHALKLDRCIQILYRKKEHQDIHISYEKNIDKLFNTGDDKKWVIN